MVHNLLNLSLVDCKRLIFPVLSHAAVSAVVHGLTALVGSVPSGSIAEVCSACPQGGCRRRAHPTYTRPGVFLKRFDFGPPERPQHIFNYEWG